MYNIFPPFCILYSEKEDLLYVLISGIVTAVNHIKKKNISGMDEEESEC